MAYCPTCPQVGPIMTDPTKVYNNFYHPQPVPVIHPVEIINQHHCVPCPQHYVTYSVKDQMVATISSRKSRKRKK